MARSLFVVAATFALHKETVHTYGRHPLAWNVCNISVARPGFYDNKCSLEFDVTHVTLLWRKDANLSQKHPLGTLET